MGWKVVVVAVPPHMRPPPHVSLCLQLPLMVLVLGWCSRWKERGGCAGWWWSGRWLLCGWQCCCCCFCCSCLTVCRALDVAMHSERCCLLSLHEVGTKTNHHAFFSSPQVGLHKTGEGNNQHPAPSSLRCGHRPHITAAVPLEQPAAADRAQP